MIKLIGVIAEGGVPVLIRSLQEIKGEKELIAGLIEAVKAISSIVGTGEVRKLDFREDKLLLMESKKKYTVFALVDMAEEYIERLLHIIAERIDEGDIPPFGGYVDDRLVDAISRIIDNYVSRTIGVDVVDIFVDIWDPILSTIRRYRRGKELVDSADKIFADAIRKQKDLWFRFLRKARKSGGDIIKYALEGDFSHACAIAMGSDDPLVRAFGVKMGLMAASMVRTISPPLDELEKIVRDLPDDDPLILLTKKAVELRLQRISLLEYVNVFRDVVGKVSLSDDRDGVLRALFLVDPVLRFVPDMLRRLEEFFRDKSDVIHTYLASMIERDSIIRKAYSITKMSDIEEELRSWELRISSLLGELDRVIRPGILRRIFGGMPGGVEANKILIKSTLGLETYMMILTLLSQSPVLGLLERRSMLERILSLYSRYCKKIIRGEYPCFLGTIMSVFQSVGIAMAEIFQYYTAEERTRHMEEVLELYTDVWDLIVGEYPKIPPYIPFIATLTSSLGPLMVIMGKKYIIELQVIYALIRTIDPQVVESWKFVLPYNYAALCGNMLGTLASLSIRVLSGRERVEKTDKCVARLIEIVKWLMAQGKMSREVILSLCILVGEIMDGIGPERLEYYVETLMDLSSIVVPSQEKQDYEIAILADALVGLLLRAHRLLRKEKYRRRAEQIYRIAIDAWKKYGIPEKAKELLEKYGKEFT